MDNNSSLNVVLVSNNANLYYCYIPQDERDTDCVDWYSFTIQNNTTGETYLNETDIILEKTETTPILVTSGISLGDEIYVVYSRTGEIENHTKHYLNETEVSYSASGNWRETYYSYTFNITGNSTLGYNYNPKNAHVY